MTRFGTRFFRRAVRFVATLTLAAALLPPGGAPAQTKSTREPLLDPVGTRLTDASSSRDECERRRDEDCDPISTVLGVVFAEYLPQLTDGVRMSYGRMPSGATYGGRLEWTLSATESRRLALSAGIWAAPTRALQPGAGDAALYSGPRDAAFCATLGGSLPLEELGISASRSLRAVGEATVLFGDPGQQFRLTIGPRYRLPVGPKTLAIDLIAGTNVGTEGLAPRIGLRIGWTWD